MALALVCDMKLNKHALNATANTVVLTLFGVLLLRWLIQSPEKIFAMIPYLFVIALVYIFWSRRLR